MRASLALASAFLIAVSAGCGDDGSDAAGGSGGSGAASEGGSGGVSTEGGGGAGTGGEGPTCEHPEPTIGDTENILVDQVTVSAQTEDGNPIDDVPLQLCGANGCLYATTNVIGQAIFSNELSSDMMDRPVVKPGDSLTYGKIGYPYTPDVASPYVVMFPAIEDSGEALVDGATVSAGGVTLELAEGTVAVFDEFIYDTAEKQTFRAASIDAERVAEVTGDPEFTMLFTLGPVDTLLCPAVAATFDNYAALPADTEVEIFAQELNIAEYFGAFSKWTKIADGVVSSDGATITTTGDGLPALLTIAIKVK